MLPAITFIFSRAACDDATRQVVGRRRPPHHRGRAGPDPPPGGGLGRAAERRRPPHPRLRGLVGRPGGRRGAPPRRPRAGLPPGRRAVLLGGTAEGRVRHRDPGPRHQHARPHGGGRAVRQVPGLGHLGPHLGRVPAADRPGRPAGHRHGGPRLRAVAPRHTLRPGGPHRRRPAPGPGVLLPPDLQPGRQPGPPLEPRGGPRAARVLLRAVAGPRGFRVPRGPAGPAPGHPRRPGLPRRVGAHRRRAAPGRRSTTSRTCWWPRSCGPGCSTASSPPTWPAWPRPSPSRPDGPGTSRPCPARPWWSSAWPRSTPWPAGCGPTSAGWACAGPGDPTEGWPGPWWPGPPGGTLDTVLRDAEVAPGDFVRNVRQVIDLVRQIGQVAAVTGHPGAGRPGRGAAAAGGGRGRRPGRHGVRA